MTWKHTNPSAETGAITALATVGDDEKLRLDDDGRGPHGNTVT